MGTESPPDGLLASLTDANNNTTNFAYDGLDRLSTTTYPLGSGEGFHDLQPSKWP